MTGVRHARHLMPGPVPGGWRLVVRQPGGAAPQRPAGSAPGDVDLL